MKKAFSIIEMAIVLAVMAVVISIGLNFVPKIIDSIKTQKAVTYMDENKKVIGNLLTNNIGDYIEGGQVKFSSVLSQKKDVYGNYYAYYVSPAITSSACFVTDTQLGICELVDLPDNFDKFFVDGKLNMSVDNGECVLTDADGNKVRGLYYSNIAYVLLSAGKNRNIQTPIYPATNGDTVVVYFKNPIKKFDLYPSTIKFFSAKDDSPIISDQLTSMEYDDIITYSTLDTLKSRCPATNEQASIDRFWSDLMNVPVGQVNTLHWAISYIGDNLQVDKTYCLLKLDTNGSFVNADDCISVSEYEDGKYQCKLPYNKCINSEHASYLLFAWN
jgi:prepilin-type N-terminal cleavage/methylation domain-containing protein